MLFMEEVSRRRQDRVQCDGGVSSLTHATV